MHDTNLSGVKLRAFPSWDPVKKWVLLNYILSLIHMRFPHNTHNHVYMINTFVLQARYCVFPIIMLSIPLQPSP